MYILVDCNQFYVSCERVFQPKLEGKPVLVLSNNDGCVVARSPEVKALKIPMGAPYFQYEEIIKRNKVHVFSSNYALYGDLSARVMETLASFDEEMEVYSIDEAFLWREGDDHMQFCKEVRAKVKQWTGIPVSLGVGPTKTLAKVANELAKKRPDGIYAVTALDRCLKDLPVEEIWGIGRKKAASLNRKAIYTAEQLANADEDLIRKLLTVTGLRTCLELRGVKCIEFADEEAPKQGIMCSRSFAQSVFHLDQLEESVATYTSMAAEKMRAQGSAAGVLQVFIIAKMFDPRYSSYTKSGYVTFKEPISYTPTLIEHAKKILRSLYSEQIPYKKTGIYLSDLVPFEEKELDLFSNCSKEEREKQERLMALLDEMNQKRDSLFFLAEGIEKPWKMKRSKTSPSFTTSWDELPKVK